jgi:hypothetical protein
MAGESPDFVIGCVGGGSNYAGFCYPFMGDKLEGKLDATFIAAEVSDRHSFEHRKYPLAYQPQRITNDARRKLIAAIVIRRAGRQPDRPVDDMHDVRDRNRACRPESAFNCTRPLCARLLRPAT